jgi:hypothetical protein
LTVKLAGESRESQQNVRGSSKAIRAPLTVVQRLDNTQTLETDEDRSEGRGEGGKEWELPWLLLDGRILSLDCSSTRPVHPSELRRRTTRQRLSSSPPLSPSSTRLCSHSRSLETPSDGQEGSIHQPHPPQPIPYSLHVLPLTLVPPPRCSSNSQLSSSSVRSASPSPPRSLAPLTPTVKPPSVTSASSTPAFATSLSQSWRRS